MYSTTLPAITAALCGFASVANAGRALEPIETGFTLTGKIEMGIFGPIGQGRANPPTCAVTMKGRTSSGNHSAAAGELKSLTSNNDKCSGFVFGNFPWDISIVSTNEVLISGMSYSYNGVNCPAQTVSATINQAGRWSFSGGGPNCAILGSAVSMPTIVIGKQ